MRLTINQLRDAFTAGCSRKSNLSLGTAYFQDFEIAMFLNEGYMISIDKRMGVYDERYVSVQMRDKIQPQVSFPNSAKSIIEFGDLYSSSGMIPAEEYSPKSNAASSGTLHYDESGGPNSIFFRIERRNGFLPYILSANFSEFEKADDAKSKITLSCKPLTVTDIPKLSMVYTADKYMPYLYYRIRKIATGQGANMKMHDYIEVIYTSRLKSTTPVCFLSYDYVAIPEPIKAEEITDPSKGNRFIEVTFGFDIIARAVQVAMESLSLQPNPTTLQTIEHRQ